MKYIVVLGAGPEEKRKSHIFDYFNNYLISIGDPTTQKGWTLFSVTKHAEKIINDSKEFKENLYIDSGGYQIILGYVKFDEVSKDGRQDRIKDFIDTYHYILEKNYENIHRIFSLDVNNFNMTLKQLYNYNVVSINNSIDLIKKYPVIADKQLFVLQTRNHRVFEIWKTLFKNLEIYKYYKLWAFGGLVGLKKILMRNLVMLFLLFFGY